MKPLKEAVESLDGATIVNLDEPSAGDLERLAKANRELLAEVKLLRAQAPTQPPPDERKGDQARAWSFAMNVFKSAKMSPDNPLFSHIQKCMMRHLRAQAPTEPTREQVAELVEAAEGIKADSYEIINDGHPKDCNLCQRHSRFLEALAPFAEKGGA